MRSTFQRVSASVSPLCEYRPDFLQPLSNHSPRPNTQGRGGWFCIRCNRSYLECLPDPPDPSGSSTFYPLAEGKTSPETEVAMPPQTAETNAVVSVREGVRGARQAAGPAPPFHPSQTNAFEHGDLSSSRARVCAPPQACLLG